LSKKIIFYTTPYILRGRKLRGRKFLKMTYKAIFGIDCGLSHGFGLKEPHYEKQDRNLSASDDKNAIIEAAKIALHFSREYLSNPDNDFTTVTILRLYDSKGKLLNPQEILKKEGFTGIQRFEWDEKGLLYIKCSMLEHLLSLVS
jgi:hypothetical protein